MCNNCSSTPTATQLLQTINRDIAHYFSPTFAHTLLVALSVDPFTIHAYWHIHQQQRLPELYQPDSGIGLVLRFQQISRQDGIPTPVEKNFEIAVKASESRRYIQLQQDGQSYRIELGIKSNIDNSFKPLAQSNLTTTPRAHPASEDQAIVFIDHRDPDGTQAQQQSMPESLATSLYQPLAPVVPQRSQALALSPSTSSSSSLG